MIQLDSTTHRHLHVHGTSPVHSVAAEAKLAGLFLFVIAVAVTPRTWVPVFVVDAVLVAATVRCARLRPGLMMRRLAAVTPFVAFAIALPFLGDGATTDLGPLTLSIDGVWATWNILAKATLGATASIIVTATTPIPDLLGGLSRLRAPATIIGIIGFMFRYLDLIVEELGRMRRSMVSRGYDPRWLWQARPIASSAGTLFVRTYERGERVHDAMAARGYTGTMPELGSPRAERADWLVALAPACIAIVALAVVGLR